MKNLETLIQELCPDGVEFVKLGDVLDYEQPTKYIVKCKDYQNEGMPVLTAGQTFILGYTDETNGIFVASKENPVIIFDDFTTSFHWVDFNFKVKSSAMKMLRVLSEREVSFRFVYYAMKCIKYQTLEHSRQWISKYSQIEIPLPPIEVQTEIVRILDKFTSLEAKLEAELDCRKRQYEYYRDKLLSFDNEGGQEVEWKKIGEICDTLSGFPFDSSKFQTSGIKLMRGKNVKRGYFDFNEDDDRYWESPDGLEKYLLQDKDIIISMDGSLVGKSFAMLSKKHLPLLLVQRVARVRAKRVNPNFLFHNIAHRFSGYVDKKKTGGAIPHVSMKDIQNFSIPVPSLQEQERIATILDRFESLTTSLQSGLPAEIAARRQQYEHYRDKLLTFKRKGAA
ncbi:restriction endonuclease subunit S [Prevotella copri]|uniref:Restriction endonuclease subunit S n=1 Tax=Segatella copri TaxID=165179 RepID=A0AA91A476_9BACT|nr:restriction endonuclease subunit S [Segatella copri]MQO10252.1 restriction endonuclease subunit S [Segatella copri]